MKRAHMVWLLAAVLLLGLGPAVKAQEDNAVPPMPERADLQKAEMEARKAAFYRDKPITLKARLEAFDPDRRVVTFQNMRNKRDLTMRIGEGVRNLSELAVGDLVVVKYYEASAVQVNKPGKPGGAVAGNKMAMPMFRKKPAEGVARQVTVTAAVEEIDHPRMHVKIQGPDGKPLRVNIRDPRNLRKVKVGDRLVITYLEPVAISVEKTGKK